MRVLKDLLLIVFVAAAVAVAGAIGLVYFVFEQLKPADPVEQEVVFTIEPGTSSDAIARLLEDNGMIRNAFIFTYYLKFKDIGTRFQAGTYAMTPGLNIQDIIRKLNEGDTVKEETFRFTVPEGYTVRQTAALLADLGYSGETLLTFGLDAAWLQSDEEAALLRASGLPPDREYRFALEGYLFPETYELPVGATERDVMVRMLGELDRKLKSLPADWESRLAERELSFHDLMTVASLIEREVVADSERTLVAGVIYNRLASGMPLQIDATVQYLFDEPKERLLEADLQVESPYNTYLNAGLPPGPIASPGLASIEAALYPEPSDYLFYVTKKDGSGEHYFGKTYNEHLQNIKRSNAN